jgi:hypothetical protein
MRNPAIDQNVSSESSDPVDFPVDADEIKKRLLFLSGKPLTAQAVARRLSIPIEWVENDRQKNHLIGIPVESYGYLYPAFQFTEDGAVLSNLDKLLQSLERFDVWMQLQFLQTGDLRLEGSTPIDALKQGKLDLVLSAAENYGEMRAA